LNWSLLLMAAIEEELALSAQIRRLIALTRMSAYPESGLSNRNDMLFRTMIAAVDNGKISFSLWFDRVNLILSHPSAEDDAERYHPIKAIMDESVTCFDQSMEDFVQLLKSHFGTIYNRCGVGGEAGLNATKLASEYLRTACSLLEWYMAKKSGHALLNSKFNVLTAKPHKPEWVAGMSSALLRIRESRLISTGEHSFYIQQIRLLLSRIETGFSESSGKQTDNSKTKPFFLK